MTDPTDSETEFPAPGAGIAPGPWQLDLESPEAAAIGAEPHDEAPPDTPRDPPEIIELPPPVERVLEALLFAGGEPLTAERAATLIRGLTAGQFRATLDSLNRIYRKQGRPYSIQSGAAGFALVVRPGFRRLRERLFGTPRAVRLSPTALDALAVVAYRQPVTRADVDTLRGAESAAALRQLVRLGLIAGVPDPARPAETTYGTTQRFLELFGLEDLDDLPRTGDLQRI